MAQSVLEESFVSPARPRSVAPRGRRMLAVGWLEHTPLPEPFVRAADMFVPGLCRKAGLFDEGLAIVERALRERPSWHAWTARGLILRHRGETDLARRAFDEAIVYDPDNPATYLEAGDALFERERWEEARRYYEAVLTREPRHPWALPSALFCRWRERSSARFPDDAYPPELYELMREGNERAHRVYDAFRPFEGYVPEPHDALTNTLRHVLRQLPPGSAGGGSLRIALTNVEAPSNLVLCRALYGDEVRLEIRHTHVAVPDPREPVAPIAFALWRREGEVLVPALDPPPVAIAETVRALASAPYRRRRAWAAASRAAARLSPGDAEALLACVVHPPPLPEGWPLEAAFEWVPRVQLTVAFVLAHLAPHEPWESSVRRAALRSLLFGPMDWSTEAAAVAFVELAHDHPILELDVHRAFATLYAGKPQEGPVCYELGLLDRWLRLPGLYPQEREALIARYDELARAA